MAKKKSSYPSIPRGKMTDSERALIETAEILTGQRGDGRNRALTPADLSDAGLITLNRNSTLGTYAVSGIGAGVDNENVTITGGGTPVTADTPTQPTSFTATGLYEDVQLQWDNPGYAGHAYTAIFRSASDDFGTAVKIQESTFRVADDTVATGNTFYYWIRHVNVLGEQGPLNATAGTVATTAQDVAQLLVDITGQITETQLNAALNTRIDDAEQDVIDAAQSASDAAASQAAALISENSAAADAISAAADALAAAQDAADANADAVQTAQDVINAANSASTAGTSATAASTSAGDALASANAAASDAANTAQDLIDTAAQASNAAASAGAALLSESATAADVIQTAADVIASAANANQTGLDAQLTAADVIATAADVIASAADVVASAASESAAGASAVSALAAYQAVTLSNIVPDSSLEEGAFLASSGWAPVSNRWVVTTGGTVTPHSGAYMAQITQQGANAAFTNVFVMPEIDAGEEWTIGLWVFNNTGTQITFTLSQNSGWAEVNCPSNNAWTFHTNSGTAAISYSAGTVNLDKRNQGANTSTELYIDQLVIVRGSHDLTVLNSDDTAVTGQAIATEEAAAAALSASSASLSDTAAGQSASAASISQISASTSASSASISASAAATSETNAAGSASTATTQSGLATGSANAASASETAAGISASQAATSASNASGSASTASTQAGLATTAASGASASETAASLSESNAATSESNAAGSASTAGTQAGLATTAASGASASETAAGLSETAAATSESNAAGSASTAGTQAGLATTAASGASASETAAALSETAAATSESNAAGSASTASTQAGISTAAASGASASETAAGLSETAAATSASNASGSASTASTQAGISTSAASAASASQTAAGISEANAATSESNAAGSSSSASSSSTLAAQALGSVQDIEKTIFRSDFLNGVPNWASGYTNTAAGFLSAPSLLNSYSGNLTIESVSGIGNVLEASNGVYTIMSERQGRAFVVDQKIRVRMRTRLTIDRTDANIHKHYMWLTGHTDTGAYAGYSSSGAATFNGLTVADGWVIREWVATPTDLRALQSNGFQNATSWRLMIGLNGYNSAGVAGENQQAEYITLEDVTSEQAAGDSAAAALISQNAASASESAAGTSASTSSTQAGIATTKAGEASTSAGSAATSASNASGSASTASTQAGLATTAKNNAETAESNAGVSAGQAATSASNASGSASTASTQAGLAATSAGQAGASAGAASTSASQAATSATNAAGSESSASESTTIAAAVQKAASNRDFVRYFDPFKGAGSTTGTGWIAASVETGVFNPVTGSQAIDIRDGARELPAYDWYAGQKIRIRFRYNSSATTEPSKKSNHCEWQR